MAQIKLIYAGKQLEDDGTLSEAGVKPGDSLHMVLQLRGGKVHALFVSGFGKIQTAS